MDSLEKKAASEMKASEPMDLASHASALAKWGSTKGAQAISDYLEKGSRREPATSEASFLAAIEAARIDADACGLPHSLIMKVSGLERRYSAKTNLVLDSATMSSGSALMVERCARAGLDPWARASSDSRNEGGVWRKVLSIERASERDMAVFCAGESVSGFGISGGEIKSKATRVALAHLAMDHAPRHGAALAIHFGRELAKEFRRAIAGSLKG